MAGEAEAIGGLASAAMAAHVLDQGEVVGKAGHGHCANCGATVHGHFCSHCGQAAHVHRSLIHVGHEFLHGITHFDGKAWKTLPLLLFRPGKLTRDYIYGKRARYVGPAPLFLFVIFLMFFVFSVTKAPLVNFNVDAAAKAMTPEEARKQLPEIDRTIGELQANVDKAKAGGRNAPPLAASEAALKAAQVARGHVKARAEGQPAPISSTDDLMDAIRHADDDGKLNVNLGDKALDEKVHHSFQNPELALYKLQGVAYKYAFLLVPLSLPWLWMLFFWKRGVRMYDHAVFALYSLSFMCLLVITVRLLVAGGIDNPALLGVLIGLAPLVHMFAQLRGAYAIGTFGALWRTGTLAIAAIVTLAIYASLIVVLGLVD
jgi:hypothetical protein